MRAQWQETLDSAQQLLALTLRALRDAGVKPLSVLENRRGGFLSSVDRTVVVDHRWRVYPVAMDAQGRVYRWGRVGFLREKWERVDHSTIRGQVRRSCLRTGLSADQQVMWGGDLVNWDVEEAVRMDHLDRFGRAADGEPLLRGEQDEIDVPLKLHLARTVAAVRNNS